MRTDLGRPGLGQLPVGRFRCRDGLRLDAGHLEDLTLVERIMLQQRFRQRVQLAAMFDEQLLGRLQALL